MDLLVTNTEAQHLTLSQMSTYQQDDTTIMTQHSVKD